MVPQPPEDGPGDPLELLEACIASNDEPAGQAFLARFRPLIRRAFVARTGVAHVEEFVEWFPGWFYSSRRIHALAARCERERQSGNCPDQASLVALVENYVVTCIQNTGVPEFFRERGQQHGGSDGLENVAASAEPYWDAEGLRAALNQLPPEIRVPFRLRYWHALGPLPQAEVEWIGAQTGITAKEVHSQVEQEAAANQELEFPLSAAFIGQLLGLQARVDGSYNSIVDQRVRRARDRLRTLLS